MRTGERVEIDGDAMHCVLEAPGRGPTLAAAAITTREGTEPEIAVVEGRGSWTVPIAADPTARTTIVLYMTDDAQSGRVENAGPLSCTAGGVSFTLEARNDRHGAVIMAEVYHRAGRRMMRARGDGFAFGVKAMARKEGLPLDPFLPARERYGSDEDDGVASASPRHRRAPDDGIAVGSGSGVIVARDHVVTNEHVVRSGARIRVHGVDGDGDARLLSVDAMHDLALLRVPGIGGDAMPIRQAGTLFLGEPVIAAGFPLRDVLGDDLKITHGNVSGMKGSGGNLAAFQFSAPIGSGSSGGAVCDQAGNLAGVVAAALAHDQFRQRGAASENMNFAVRGSLVLELLAAHGIEFETAPHDPDTPARIAARIRRSVVSVIIG